MRLRKTDNRIANEAHLPYQQSPQLFIAPQVRHDLDMKEVLGVRNADQNRGSDEPEEQELRDGGSSKTGSEHVRFGALLEDGSCGSMGIDQSLCMRRSMQEMFHS